MKIENLRQKMRQKTRMIALAAIVALSLSASGAWAQENHTDLESYPPDAEVSADDVSELNPFAPGVEELLERFDEAYEKETGQSSRLDQGEANLLGCYRESCRVWIRVVKSEQRLYLYVGGSLQGSWAVSTGTAGRRTPNFDTHPNGRIYDRYTSTRYPEGDYQGLGNMPYAIFIRGGFALHGTPVGNWSKLGRPASHGCIRQHPDNAYRLNRLVRSAGIRNTWITVH